MRDLDDLTERLKLFRDARDWSQFHTPKNLAMALAGEVGELLAELQWLTNDQVAERLSHESEFRARLEDEIADVMIYLTYLADATGTDLVAVAGDKVARNEVRYRAEASRGRAVKHTRLQTEPEDA
ncbi:nucleotide pyrophosphohydrolase [Promicromonospora sp. NPDC057488]|uniref:nucleotide pyrophosphohydrolase n=1 Tax=Promicromonospora sp. NPDC057488 TaxID=3346147 RepID=UPI00366B8FDB